MSSRLAFSRMANMFRMACGATRPRMRRGLARGGAGVIAVVASACVTLRSGLPVFAETAIDASSRVDEGVFFDSKSGKWCSRVMMDGELKKLRERDSREQAERDYEYVTARLTGSKISESPVTPDDDAPLGSKLTKEEQDQRLVSIKIMNLVHVDPSKMSRERKLEFISQISKVVADDDVPVLWRLARGLHNLTDEYFESREEQVELLELGYKYAKQALDHAPGHAQAYTWFVLSSLRLVDTKLSILLTESKSYGVAKERKVVLTKERGELEAERARLRGLLSL